MLTNAAAKAAGARDRAYKLHDRDGLHLLVRPTGSKSWQQKYRWKGAEQLHTHGRYPEMSLDQARRRALELKDDIAAGRDPRRTHQGGDISQTFERLARAWHRHNRPSWSAAHAGDVLAGLERDVFPDVGALAPDAIAAPRLLKMLRAIEARGCVASAQRLRQRLVEIFAYGIAEGLAEKNPATDLGAAMLDVPPATPHPALTAVNHCRQLLEACELTPARPITRLASRLLALTAVRLDSVRGMRWGELEDLDGPQPLWRVPPARMKLKRSKKDEDRYEHLVPLSAAAVAVLRDAAQLCARERPPHDRLVFPGRGGSAPIGEGSIGELYDRAGFAGRHVPHGWRASFSTILNEDLGEDWARTIDRALAHSPKDKVEAAYNRAQLLERRRAVFNRWGELLAG